MITVYFHFGQYEIFKGRRPGLLITVLTIVLAVLIPALIISGNNKNKPVQTNTEPVSGSDVELTVEYSFAGVSVKLPKGFYIRGTGDDYYAKNKSTADFIIFSEDPPEAVDATDIDSVKKNLKSRYGDTLGEVSAAGLYDIGGYRAVTYKSSYKDVKDTVTLTVCCIAFADKTVVIGFNEYTDIYSDAFTRCIDTFRIDAGD